MYGSVIYFQVAFLMYGITGTVGKVGVETEDEHNGATRCPEGCNEQIESAGRVASPGLRAPPGEAFLFLVLGYLVSPIVPSRTVSECACFVANTSWCF